MQLLNQKMKHELEIVKMRQQRLSKYQQAMGQLGTAMTDKRDGV